MKQQLIVLQFCKIF